MELKQKDIIWLSVVIAFYILSGVFGLYNITSMVLFPLLAVPMTLLLIKTRQNELIMLIGVILAVVISFLSTGSPNIMVMSSFLLFILAPAFAIGTLYEKKTNIPRIIIVATIVVFLGGLIFLVVSKALGVDYLDIYFFKLDQIKSLMNDELAYEAMQNILPQGDHVREVYLEALGKLVLQAKRTYPATLFTMSLIASTIQLCSIQFIAYVRSWERPRMKSILNVGLSRVAGLVLVGLWIINIQIGNTDNVLTFTSESMLIVLFTLFQIIGMISLIVMINKLGAEKLIRNFLIGISVFWLIFNPTLLVMIGCLDSLFNFRKVQTLI